MTKKQPHVSSPWSEWVGEVRTTSKTVDHPVGGTKKGRTGTGLTTGRSRCCQPEYQTLKVPSARHERRHEKRDKVEVRMKRPE